MTSAVTADLELGELLQEFQDVVEELKAPSQSKPHAYQHVLQQAKSRTGLGDDSGVEDSDYTKLGDTRELESFIDMLDRELAEM
ncbi:regulator of cell cycle RGCC-like isoform X2 [Perca fluviatilis]|uniref:regulator of cell cycle RGCC-like isoform X2 n=1 Tax=Perca fluviatilis TaxID=8168 RepID=UPI0019662350|nr:regulator of cell cycle RGCC-like isoform X2 [Perca fluviatilis]